MNTTSLERIVADISQLSLSEQLWLMERIAQQIRERALDTQPVLEDQLAMMAADPDIQRELREIEAEFAGTGDDGLGTDQ